MTMYNPFMMNPMGGGGMNYWNPQNMQAAQPMMGMAGGSQQNPGDARIDKLKGRISNLQEQYKGAGSEQQAGIQARMDQLQGRVKGLRQDRRRGQGMYDPQAQGGAQPEPMMFQNTRGVMPGSMGINQGFNPIMGGMGFGGMGFGGFGGMPQMGGGMPDPSAQGQFDNLMARWDRVGQKFRDGTMDEATALRKQERLRGKMQPFHQQGIGVVHTANDTPWGGGQMQGAWNTPMGGGWKPAWGTPMDSFGAAAISPQEYNQRLANTQSELAAFNSNPANRGRMPTLGVDVFSNAIGSGSYNTPFGNLVTSSTGNRNVYKRNGASENDGLYYYDPGSSQWNMLTPEQYAQQAPSMDWNYYNPQSSEAMARRAGATGASNYW